jgi:two-component system, NtrC family, sensor histidine kinase PilS
MIEWSFLRQTRWSAPGFSFFQLIKWWMLLRAVLVSTTMAVVFFFGPREGASAGAQSLLAPAVSLFTAAVSWLFYRGVKRGTAREIHYYLQYFLDIVLISLLTLISLPAEINFVPLFLLTITVASILSFRSGAFFTATAATILYLPLSLGVVSLGFTFSRALEINVFYLANRAVWVNTGLQIFLFYTIASATSYLSQRLRHAGWELEDARRMLWQYKVDTGEILQNIDSGLITCSEAGVVVYANTAAARILGLSKDRLLGRPARAVFACFCPELGSIIFEALETHRITTHRQVSLTSGGTVLSLLVNSSLLLEQNGKLRGVSLIFQDNTLEIKARELELRAGKLAAVAELSASLAHEIKNPLSSIRSAVELLRDTESDGGGKGSPRDRLMNCILKESDRLTDLLKQFLQFASGVQGPLETIELGAVLDGVLDSVRHHPDWRDSLTVQVAPEAAALRVTGHAQSLAQVFFNLLINAAQAEGPDGGRAGLIVVDLPDRAPEEARGTLPGDRECVWLRVRDDGPGIGGALRQRIFEPFFTTRRHGFGLGLAVVHRIVNSLGGFICVEDAPGGAGAAFVISLPRGAENPPAAGGAEGSRKKQARASTRARS